MARAKRRCRLREDFTDQWGQKFSTEQTGEASWWEHGKDYDDVLVDFDGYDAERKLNEQMIAEDGEGWNIVPWMAHVPKVLLEWAEPDEDTPP